MISLLLTLILSFTSDSCNNKDIAGNADTAVISAAMIYELLNNSTVMQYAFQRI